MLLQLVYIVRASCPGGRLLQSWELVDKKENEKGISKSKEEKDIVDKSFTSNLSNHVDTKPLRYVEKEKEGANQSQPLPQSLPLNTPSSPVIMLLSDGCIEDISSLLFTTVVANLSAIVGHDIDGQPLYIPKRLSTLQCIASFLDPYGFMGIRGIC